MPLNGIKIKLVNKLGFLPEIPKDIGYGKLTRWRVYVSNIHGIQFEVRTDLTPEQAMQYWAEYLSLVK